MRAVLPLAGIALAVSGCSLVDEYVRPVIPLPASWSESAKPAAVAAPVPAPAAAWPAADWWKGFGSPALDAYMAQAKAANFDLAAAIARVRQADAQVRINGAPLLPSLDLNAGGQRNQTPSLTPASSTTASSNAKPVVKNTFSTNLSASWELDFWGKNGAALESAEAAAAASRFDQQTVFLTVQSSVATTYFDSLGVQDRLALAKADVSNAEGVLAAIRDRMRFGTATDLDVAQQESVVAGLRAQVPPLEQQLRQDGSALAVLIGRLPEEVPVAAGTLGALAEPAVAPGLPSELLERRPDVRYAEAQLIGANADIGAARAALFPSLTLTAEYGFESLALSTLLHSNSALFSVASNLAQPIFHAGALSGEADLKQARYDELVQNYRKAVVSAFSDVENALNATRKTAEEEQAQQAAAGTARRAYDIAMAQFRAGVIDITTLLNTQKTLFSAQDALAQAKLTHVQAEVGLFKALGGGWHAEPGPAQNSYRLRLL